jgi:hypothetical protein
MLSRPLTRARPGQFKVKFSSADDDRLREIVGEIGTGQWNVVADRMPPRTARQCKERWNNYINPAINNIEWTQTEDQLLEQKQAELGANWRSIAKFFATRSKNNVKNRWLRLQRIKARFEEAARASSTSQEYAGGIPADRISIWNQLSFEPAPDQAAWDELFRDFPVL